MNKKDFILEQSEMIKKGYGLDQIKDNIFRRVFTANILNLRINACINICMDLYAEIILAAKTESNGK